MTLFTANALLWRETRQAIRGIAMLPHEAISLGYLDWLRTQEKSNEHISISWIEKISDLNVVRDPGMTCLEALSARANNDERIVSLGEPINNSKGCGAVMRVAPIGLFVIPDKVGEVAAYSAAITHGHPLAVLSSFVMAKTISVLMNGDIGIRIAVKKALDEMMKWQPDYYKNNRRYRLHWDNEKNELKSLVELAVNLVDGQLEDQNAITQLGQGWVAEEALAIAVYSVVKYEDSFKDAVVCAVNHDGDSDSTGAIAGNIIGAKVGYNAIPKYYRDNVGLKDIILEIADDLISGVPLNKSGVVSDKKWLVKYLYCDKNAKV